MVNTFFDQYSLLHFASGVVAYFWGVPRNVWFFVHFVFEIIENTATGIRLINEVFTWWPGGKSQPDTILNIIGDNLFAFLGWVCASQLDEFYT